MKKIKKTLNLIVRLPADCMPDGSYTVRFVYDANVVEDPEQALREAARKYLASPESKLTRQYAGGRCNWGDIFSSMPVSFFAKEGLFLDESEEVVVELDHDEVLC